MGNQFLADSVEELKLFMSTMACDARTLEGRVRGYQIAKPIIGTMAGEWKLRLNAALAVWRGEAFAVRWY
jgi:hypothetical protein